MNNFKTVDGRSAKIKIEISTTHSCRVKEVLYFEDFDNAENYVKSNYDKFYNYSLYYYDYYVKKGNEWIYIN